MSVIGFIGGRWDILISRRQHFMKRFAMSGNDVFYLQSPRSVDMFWKRGVYQSPILGCRIMQADDRIHLLSPSYAWPPRHWGPISRLNHRRWAGMLSEELQFRGHNSMDLLWVLDPRWVDGLDKLTFRTLVFDMVDDYLDPEYGGQRLRGPTMRLLSQADLVVLTSWMLAKLYGGLTRRFVVIPNGFDSDKFSFENVPSAPDDMPYCPGPLFLHTGTLFRHLDYSAMIEVAEAAGREKGVLVLIGRVEEPGHPELEKLLNSPNCTFLGEKQHDELPAYVANADVCIALFKPGKVASSVSPLKLYEYLGCGKPSITLGLSGFRSDPLFQFTYPLEEMSLVAAIDACLNESEELKVRRAEQASELGSWDYRFSQVQKALKDLMG